MAREQSAGNHPLRVTVLGAGHGGLATAAHLTLKGHAVTLFSFFGNELAPVVAQGGIRVQGDVEGFASPVRVAASIDDAVKEAELIMLISPALSHQTYASLLSGCLRDGQLLLLSPGRTGGALEFARVLRRYAARAQVLLAEAQTFLYATESRGAAQVEIMKEKEVMRVAALPARRTGEVVEILRWIYPQIEPGGECPGNEPEQCGRHRPPGTDAVEYLQIGRSGGRCGSPLLPGCHHPHHL